MSLLWRLMFLAGFAYSSYKLITGIMDGRTTARFGVIADRREDALAFWLLILVRTLISLGLLLLFLIAAIF